MRHFILLLICILPILKCTFSTTETPKEPKKKEKIPQKPVNASPSDKNTINKDTDFIKTGATISKKDENHKGNSIIAEVYKNEKSPIDDTKNKISQKPISTSPSDKSITNKKSSPIKTNTTQKENEKYKDHEVNKDEKLLRDDLKNKNFIRYSANKIMKLLTDSKLLSSGEIENLKKSNDLYLDTIYEKVLKLLFLKIIYQDGKIESLINSIKNDKNIVLSELLIAKLKQFKKRKDPPFGLATGEQKEFIDCPFDKNIYDIDYENYTFFGVTHDGNCGFESFIVLFLLQFDTKRKVKKIMNTFKKLINKYTIKKHKEVIENAQRSKTIGYCLDETTKYEDFDWFKSTSVEEKLKNLNMVSSSEYYTVLRILTRKIRQGNNFIISLTEKTLLIKFFRYILPLISLESDENRHDIHYTYIAYNIIINKSKWFFNELLLSFDNFIKSKKIFSIYFSNLKDSVYKKGTNELELHTNTYDPYEITCITPGFISNCNSFKRLLDKMGTIYKKNEFSPWLTYPVSYDKALLYFKDSLFIDPVIKKEPIENEWFPSEIIEEIYNQALIKDKGLLIKVINGTAPIDTFLETELKTKTTLLHILTQQNDLERIKILVEIRKAKLNIKDSLGNYALQYAYESDFIADNNNKTIDYLKKQMSNQSISIGDEKKMCNSFVKKLKNIDMDLINSLNSCALLEYRSANLKYLNEFIEKNNLYSYKDFSAKRIKEYTRYYNLSKSIYSFNKNLFRIKPDLLRIIDLLLKNNIKHRTITTLDYLIGCSIFENDFNLFSILVGIFNNFKNSINLRITIREIIKDWKSVIEDLNSEI